MLKFLFYRCIAVLGFIVFLSYSSVCLAAPIGKVIAFVPGVVAERDKTTVPLKLKDDIYPQDILRSDSTGKVQIIFDDDTVLSIGNNTTFSLQEYNNTDAPAFKGNLVNGFARFVTGQVVTKNPEAFRIDAPKCTIGIRGTTFAVQAQEGQTTVYTENSNNQQSVTANGLTVPPGSKANFDQNGKSSGPQPMTQQDRQTLNEQGAVSSSGASQPSAGPKQLASSAQSLPEAAAGEASSNNLGTSLSSVSTSNSVSAANTGPENMPTEVIAHGSGTFSQSQMLYTTSNTFYFKANLSTGAISDAWMKSELTGQPGTYLFTATNGSGQISGNGYSISGNSGDYTNTPLTNWEMIGNTVPAIGASTGGTYKVGISGNDHVASGTFSGTISATQP